MEKTAGARGSLSVCNCLYIPVQYSHGVQSVTQIAVSRARQCFSTLGTYILDIEAGDAQIPIFNTQLLTVLVVLIRLCQRIRKQQGSVACVKASRSFGRLATTLSTR